MLNRNVCVILFFALLSSNILSAQCCDCPFAKNIADRIIEEYFDVFEANSIDSKLAISIVMPEIRRYSYLSNTLESILVESSIRFESSAFDYSIGVFQMKISFVEDLLKEYLCIKNEFFSSIAEEFLNLSRSEIAEQLNSVKGSVKILCLFMKLVDIKFRSLLEGLTSADYVAYASTIYNFGIYITSDEIVQNLNHGVMRSRNNKCDISYGRIAECYYDCIK